MTTGSKFVGETVAPDEEALTAEFIAFLKEASGRRHPTGPVQRFNQGRAAGCVEAEFTVREGLPAEQRVGLFAERRTYKAFIRFANATADTDKEKDTRGMSISLADVGGAMLVVSQFTLYGDCRKGRRPSFIDAAPPEMAEALYEAFILIVDQLRIPTARGRFRTNMAVELTNDGPVTIWIDTAERNVKSEM